VDDSYRKLDFLYLIISFPIVLILFCYALYRRGMTLAVAELFLVIFIIFFYIFFYIRKIAEELRW